MAGKTTPRAVRSTAGKAKVASTAKGAGKAGKLRYKRILLKVSGEALMGSQGFGIDPQVASAISSDIAEAVRLGARVAVVIGGGNIFRGVALAANGADRVIGDQMGMLATVINALAMKMALNGKGVEAVVLSAIEMPKICESFTQRALESHLDAGRVVVFAGGTGNPYFTTDTAAALRACEIKADAIFKGTQVDGVYSADPKKDKGAIRYEMITHTEVLNRGLKIMDAAAISLARDASIPIIVFSLENRGEFARILQGRGRCTTVSD